MQLAIGEVYDRPEIVAVDQRRGVVTLRVPAVQLLALSSMGARDLVPGAFVYVVDGTNGKEWTASRRPVVGLELADGVPGAGSGYRLFRFSARASDLPGALVVDGQGAAIGILTRVMNGESIAVPLESVIGIAHFERTVNAELGKRRL